VGFYDGSCNAILTTWNNLVVFGGSFTTLGDGVTSAKNIVAWNGSAWSTFPSGSSNGLGGSVSALAVFNSKLYVGGSFTTLGDGVTSAKNIVAWDGSAWSTLPSGSSNGVGLGVSALAVFNSKLYVGGIFTSTGDGALAKGIVAWNGTAWSVLRSGTGNGFSLGAVFSLAVFGSKLYVGGAMASLYDGTTVNRIAAWDGSAWSTLPGRSSSGVNNIVNALAVFNSKLYVGGSFTTLGDGSTSANRIASWNGSAWSNLTIHNTNGVGESVYALAVFNSKLYVGGQYWTLGDTSISAKCIASWDGSTWSNLTTAGSNGLGGIVRALAVNGTSLLFGGGFVNLGDDKTPMSRITTWDSATSSFSPFRATEPSLPCAGLQGYVYASAMFAGTLHVGGSFLSTADETIFLKNIASWDGIAWSALPSGSGNGVNGAVRALAVFNSKLYVGGSFTALGDGVTSAQSIASWDGSAWSTLPSGSSNGFLVGISTVYALAAFNSKLYIGGSFTTLGDGVTSAKYIASWDGNTFANLTYGRSNGVAGGGTTMVNALAVFNSKLYVGGSFTTLGDTSVSAKYIASWDGSAWSNLTIHNTNGVGSRVTALAVFNSKLYVGGSFTTLADTSISANYIASWNGSAWSNLTTAGSNGLGGFGVTALAVFNSKLYVGGSFTTLVDGVTSANRIASWDGVTFENITGGSSNGVGGGVNTLAANGTSSLYIGGGASFSSFATLGDGVTPAGNIAVVHLY
jgi:hypothetical protein